MVFAGFTLTTKILSRENFSTCIIYARAIICGRGYGHFVLVRVKIAAIALALSESSLVGSSVLVLTLALILALMSLLQYFKRAEGRLPCPSWPLSRAMPSTAISSANKLVLAKLDKSSMPSQSKRGSYQKYTAEDRALIVKKAATDGIASAMRYFSARGYASLKESSVCATVPEGDIQSETARERYMRKGH